MTTKRRQYTGEPHAEFTAKDVRGLLADEVRLAGTQTKLAARIGMSIAHLSEILSGVCEPGEKTLRWLKLERHTVYRPRTGA